MPVKKTKRRKKKVKKSEDFDISEIVSDLAEKFEIEVMSEDSPDRTPYYIKFRHRGLQMITGGVPGGRMTEIRADSQTGKCLPEDTLVATLSGPKSISELKVGEKIFGYNNDGSISPTTIVDVIHKGRQRVWELKNRNRIIAVCTKEHKWLSESRRYKIEVKKLSDIEKRGQIKRVFVNYTCGKVNEPHAYAIGALLGNGCAKQRGTKLYISSAIDEVPNKVAKILNVEFVYRSHETNYTYILSTTPKGSSRGKSKASDVIQCNYYNDWIKDLYAGEKTCSWEVVDSWNRESILNLLAGLIDTDGCVRVDEFDILNISFSSTSYDLADIFQKIVYKVFQLNLNIIEACREHDNKSTEYCVNVRAQVHSKRILKELDSYLVNPFRKYKKEYDSINEYGVVKEDRIGFRYGKSYYAETYDIEVDNKTHLYVLHNEGLITHNSYLLYELGIETIKMGGAFLLHDIETAYEPAYGIRVGLEGNRKFALSEEKKMENIFALSRQFVLRVRKKNKTCPILIGADSYPPIQTNLSVKEIEQHAKDGAKSLKGYREAKKNALFSNLIGEFITFMRETDTTFVLLNQLKKQIGVIFGDDKTSNADNIIKYYVTLRLQGEVGKKIRNPDKTINGVKRKGRQVGVVSHWKTIKNRKLSPHKNVSTRILYKTGVDRLSGLQDLLITEDIVSRIKGKPKLVDYKGRELTIENLMKKKPSLFREMSE